ncbi:trifunctional fatty acid synthase subunit FAS2 [Ascoidea rubescens DSM 1968]|uniref:Fatty acid synthase subunit alpha n=1 Tax=Ascoidea rubescens DSM 1968 TaxID=1344418 RepID=A0A1D2VHX7_9ASCO|nr:3-oxoacyl-synthase [Ascoidea rubescens DSM 1968]ODV61264.1 3-oxoacyl-synthase [Ascoidea rubescens DSM 1968]
MRPEVEQELAHTLLIELLAYQFASPVRWIETQKVIFEEKKISKFIEIGPSPTLVGMAKRTLKNYEPFDQALNINRELLSYANDQAAIYYTEAPSAPKAAVAAASKKKAIKSDSAPKPKPAASRAPAPIAAAPAPVAAAAPVADQPLKATFILQVIVAHKLKKSLADIPMSKTIKDLVNGKSTIQNEILGDLEFGSTPEKPEDTPLQELADSFQESYNGELGKTSTALISKFISSKMPGGFTTTSAKSYLQKKWGLGEGRQNASLLVALTMQPEKRLASEDEANSFLDSVAQKYASVAGVNLSQGGAAGGAAGGMPMFDPSALDEITKDQKTMARQHLEILARYLKIDLREGDKKVIEEQNLNKSLQSEIDLFNTELGDAFVSGIKPIFSSKKCRVYDSFWNWARQDVLQMYYDIIFGRLSNVDREIVSKCIAVMNKASEELITFMQYHIRKAGVLSKDEDNDEFKYSLAYKLGTQLIENCKQVLEKDPAFKDVDYPTGPKTTITEKGDIKYAEVPRDNIRSLSQYVTTIAQGGELTKIKEPTLKEDLVKVYKALIKQASLTKETKLEVNDLYSQLLTFIDDHSEEIETKRSAASILASAHSDDDASDDETSEIASLPDKTEINQPVSSLIPPETIPFLHIQKKTPTGEWLYDRSLTATYLDTLEDAAMNGITFKEKFVLVTGAGRGSIGADIVKGLITGGAKVIVTTSRFNSASTNFYKNLYIKYGSKGSKLIVVPFNQGSVQDVDSLINFIYSELGWDLDAIIPFAAIPENGIQATEVNSKSELAHRIMLTNVYRIMGQVKIQKEKRGFRTRPAEVILPLSPNHGLFGSDGLYSESKISLETLFAKWASEDWGSYLTIVGAVIGWTRGTGLMSGNNMVAEGIEKYGVRTFSQQEMAFNLLGLLSEQVTQLAQDGPVKADLNGGFQFLTNLRELTANLRAEYQRTSEIRKAVSVESSIEHKVVFGENDDHSNYNKVELQPRSNMQHHFPTLKPYKDIKKLAPDLENLIDLESVIVVTGFAEVSPFGSSATRWDMEANGGFCIESTIYLAYIMGLIRYENTQKHAGWVDAKSGAPIEDQDIHTKYGKYIIEHTGIRLIEPDLFNGYDPSHKQLLQEVVVEHDMEPFVTSEETALAYKKEHKDKCEIFKNNSGEYSVAIKKGAILFIPKAIRFNRLVAGQIPTGWDAKRYGVPDDIIDQVDQVTLFNLVATIEALVSSGVCDPYEFYKYIHVSEFGICSGSGMGGINALRGMFKDRYKDMSVQNDILQESFINTMSAWVNMLLVSSSGPILTPVGACATAIESVEVGCEVILNKKAKVCIVGGYDDLQEEGSFEFANMKATSDAVEELESGRPPTEMSRPATTSRNGFMESQGSGIQVIMTAKLALEMGVPIYAIVGMTSTASDKIGRSVPAPGKGILTTAREHHGSYKYPTPILDIKFRKRQLEKRIRNINRMLEEDLLDVEDEALSMADTEEIFNKEEFINERVQELKTQASKEIQNAKRYYTVDIFKNERIAPLRASLAAFGLTIDDLGVASFHGTSTKANDKNESETIDRMLKHLGRAKGNPVIGVFQKYLTGHPKGAAGAWMLNGAIQILNSGTVPGNRNADNVDNVLQQYDHILYPSKTLKTDGIKAVSVTSFGFGQKGAQAIVIHPDYIFGAIDENTYNDYAVRRAARQKRTYRYLHTALTRSSMFVAKKHAPFDDALEQPVYLDPLVRVELNDKELKYSEKAIQKTLLYDEADKTGKMLSLMTKGQKNVGVDVELISEININNETFIERNFTESEILYCSNTASPQSSFAGTWSAKEAVFKALDTVSLGAGAPLKDIEIIRDAKTGAPKVQLHGDAADAAIDSDIRGFQVSISHNDIQAVAVAFAEI